MLYEHRFDCFTSHLSRMTFSCFIGYSSEERFFLFFVGTFQITKMFKKKLIIFGGLTPYHQLYFSLNMKCYLISLKPRGKRLNKTIQHYNEVI